MDVGKPVAIAVVSCFLFGSFAVGASAHTPSKPLLRIAKTRSSIKPHGWLSPWTRGSVRILLSVRSPSGRFERVAARRVTLERSRDHDGDGTRDSTFETTFRRPPDGACRVVVRYRHEGSVASDSDVFDCAMPEFGTGEVEFTSVGEPPRIIDVFLAETEVQRQYGLMYRRWLHPEWGMVFMFEQDGNGGFWMKNTIIPLSIAFFDVNGRIVDILHMEPCYEPPPEGCPTYTPDSSYRGALEVNQGAFSEWGIEEGDLIEVRD